MTCDDEVTLEEAILLTMKELNWPRGKAERELRAAVQSGKIPATGINRYTGKREAIPPSAFRLPKAPRNR